MFKLGRLIPDGSVLNWRDIFDNLQRYAAGLNLIGRDSLKKGSVLRSHVRPEVLLTISGGYGNNINMYIEQSIMVDITGMPPGLGGFGGDPAQGETTRYKVLRRFRGLFELPDREFGSYLISWRIQLGLKDTNDGDPVSLPPGMVELYAECSVDGVKQFGPFGSDDFVPPGFDASFPYSEYALSGTSLLSLLPGRHVVDVDFISMPKHRVIPEYIVNVLAADVSITRFNW